MAQHRVLRSKAAQRRSVGASPHLNHAADLIARPLPGPEVAHLDAGPGELATPGIKALAGFDFTGTAGYRRHVAVAVDQEEAGRFAGALLEQAARTLEVADRHFAFAVCHVGRHVTEISVVEDLRGFPRFAFAQPLQAVESVGDVATGRFCFGQMVEQVPSEDGFFGAVDFARQTTGAVVAVGGASGGFGGLVQSVEGVGGAAGFGAVAGGVVAVARRPFTGRVEFGEAVERVVGVAGFGFEALIHLARHVAGGVVAVFQRFEHGERFCGFRDRFREPASFVVEVGGGDAVGAGDFGEVALGVVGEAEHFALRIGERGDPVEFVVAVFERPASVDLFDEVAAGVVDAGERLTAAVVDRDGAPLFGVADFDFVACGVGGAGAPVGVVVAVGAQGRFAGFDRGEPVGGVVAVLEGADRGGLGQLVPGRVVGVGRFLFQRLGDFGEAAEFVVAIAGRVAARVGDRGEVAACVVAVFRRHRQRLFGFGHPVERVIGIGGFFAAGVGHGRSVATAVVAVFPDPAFGAFDFGQLVGEVVGIARFLAAPVDDFARLEVAVVGDFRLLAEWVGVGGRPLHRVAFDFPDVFGRVGDLGRQAVGVVGVFGFVAFGRGAGEDVAERVDFEGFGFQTRPGLGGEVVAAVVFEARFMAERVGGGELVAAGVVAEFGFVFVGVGLGQWLPGGVVGENGFAAFGIGDLGRIIRRRPFVAPVAPARVGVVGGPVF